MADKNPEVLPSTLDAVIVYRSGATVHRTLEVTAIDGRLPETIEIPLLPLSLVDATVRLFAVQAEAELITTDVHVGLYVAPKEDLPEPPEVDAFKKIQLEIMHVEAEIRQRHIEIDLLTSMEVPGRPEGEDGKPPPASPMAARLALEEFVNEAVGGRMQECRELQEKLHQLREEEADLARRRDRAREAETVRSHEITKKVIARLKQGEQAIEKATLQLSYFIPGARWSPAYQCRLTRDCGTAAIGLRALVCQQSGEDWKGVRLSLSTATPMRWTELPELTAVRIGKEQAEPPERRGFRPPPVGGSWLFHDFDQGRKVSNGLLPPASSWTAPNLTLAPLTVGSELVSRVAGLEREPQAMRAAMEVELERSEAMTVDEDAFEEVTPFGEMDMDHCALEAPPVPAAAAAAAPPPPPAAKMAKRAPAAPSRKRRKKGGMRRAAEPPAVEVQEAVVFRALRLGHPADPLSRNKLQPEDQRSAYMGSLANVPRTIGVDVMNLIASAETMARQVSNLSLPDRAVAVDSDLENFDFAYDADEPVDVPSDARFHSVPLGVRTTDSDVRYVVVPRTEPNAYRLAKLTNPIKSPLLRGPAEIYVGDEYILTTQLPTVPSGGNFQLGLGVEQAIKCARNTKFEENRSDSKVVGTNDLTHKIEVELVNNLDRNIRCEVRERIPQPATDAEVVVEETEVEPAWEPYDQEERGEILEGGRRWTIEIPARSNISLSAEYVVKIYTQNEIVGGNRREA